MAIVKKLKVANEQLRSTMWRLAYDSRELCVLMPACEETAINRPEVLQRIAQWNR